MAVLVVGKGGTLGAALAERLDADALELRMPDPTNDEVVPEIARADVVVNAGGPRVRPGLGFADYFREHVGVAGRVVRSMRAGTHLVFLSSTAVFGARSGPPLSPTTPEAPTLFPSAAYACAKLAAETTTRALARERDVRVTVLRPSMVYGPGIDSALESVRRLRGRGLSLRFTPGRLRQHLVHIDLLVAAVAHAASQAPPQSDRILLAADPFVLTNDDLVLGGGAPIVLPVDLADVAGHMLGGLGIDAPSLVETLSVLAIDNEFDSRTLFTELDLDPATFARERTFDRYYRKDAP